MICIIGSETTRNYGLLKDLAHSPDYWIVYTRTPIQYRSFAWSIIRRIKRNDQQNKPVHRAWEKSIMKNLDRVDRMVVVDTALKWLELSFLKRCREIRPDLQIDCLLLNSTKSWTFLAPKIHSKFISFDWNTILTFDHLDAEENNWVYTGIHYYSKTPLPAPRKLDSDLFFAGSVKDQRGKKLLQLLDSLNENDVKCRFICPCLGWRHYLSKQPKGMRLIWKRISYKRILKKMLRSNCILEVLQEGQGGSSLRYMEAVCYNKKLLTTNPGITKYPFYDERYMKVFSTEADIDYDWVKKVEPIDYGYNNEFSPVGLFSALPFDRG